eukprot:jgi/Bigna1/79580/fgenesh1_pg.63_\
MTKGSCDNTINEEQFITLVTAAAKESKNSSSSSKDSAGDEEAPSGKGISAELARALFSVADKDKNGGVDFRELMVSLSLLSKGPESTKERLHHLIHAFDYNGDGVLATREIRELATVLVRHRLRAKTGRKKDDDGNESPTPSQEVENMYNELLELDADSNTKMTPDTLCCCVNGAAAGDTKAMSVGKQLTACSTKARVVDVAFGDNSVRRTFRHGIGKRIEALSGTVAFDSRYARVGGGGAKERAQLLLSMLLRVLADGMDEGRR